MNQKVHVNCMIEHKSTDSITNMKCICCLSDEIIKVTNQSFFNLPILKCKNCKLHFVWDKDLILDLEKYYNETYWDVFRNIKNKKFSEQKVDNAYLVKKLPKFIQKFFDIIGVRKSFSRSQLLYLSPFLNGKQTMFELGSGEGFILQFFEKRGFNVFGLEPSKTNLDIINKKLKHGKCITGSANDIDTLKKKFDVIIISHVFEHLKDCRKVLLDLKQILSKGGILFIDVPNCSDITTLNESIYTQPHIHHFTKKSLEELALTTGFRIVKIDFYYGRVSTLYQHIKYLLFWIFGKDFFVLSDQHNGNYLRIILSNE